MKGSLRKVMFKKWIPIQYSESEAGISKPINNTGCWEHEFSSSGLFHQWGVNYEMSNEGFGNYTVAIVELPDGTIEQVIPSNLKFID